MCGIAGSVGFKADDEAVLRLLKHRGPNAQTTFSHGDVTLYHARLSIQDVQCGAQPMSRGNLTIVFNGEIYNHLELRKKLLPNESFITRSDTETLLALYERYGLDFLDETDGMFAFCILDKTTNRLLFARDRAGKKPLYYHQDGLKFCFASELNTLKRLADLQVDERCLGGYLRAGYMFGDSTPYKQTKELQAGCTGVLDMDSMSFETKRWWSIRPFYENRRQLSLQDALEECDSMLHTAVLRRLESSDLEVGAFLSGGIDSGLVSAVASQHVSSLRTFTVSFDDTFDEAPLAKLVAAKYGTKHTEISISMDDLAQNVEGILSNYGEPFFDSSAIPSWYVSREAKKHITVVLNGDGADELFGGYRRYVPFRALDFFALPDAFGSILGAIAGLLPQPNEKMSRYNWAYRLLFLAGGSGELDRYLRSTADIFEGYERHLSLSSDAMQPMSEHLRRICSQNISGLGKLMSMDFDSLLAGDLLVKMDIATMAHALESRSPFLSKEFLTFAPSLPDELKINGTTTKYLLRKLAVKYLPDELINAPKRGFEIPLREWVDGVLNEQIRDRLKKGCYAENFISSKFLQELLDGKANVGAQKRAKMLWTLYALEVWHGSTAHRV